MNKSVRENTGFHREMLWEDHSRSAFFIGKRSRREPSTQPSILFEVESEVIE